MARLVRRPRGGLPGPFTRLRRDRVSLVALLIIAGLAIGAARTGATAEVTLTGAVDANWRGSYDILVRPAGSELGIESTDGLIEPNFLDYRGGGPGISLDDLAFIRAIPGVAVAAPVSVVGYVTSSALAPETAVASVPVQPTLYRLMLTTTTSDGRTTLPFSTETATVLLGGDQPLAAGSVISISSSSDVTTNLALGWLPLPAIRTEVIGVDPVAEEALLGPRGAFLEPLASVPTSERGNLTAQTFDCGLDKAALAVLGTTGCVPAGPLTGAPLVPLVVADRLPATLAMRLSVARIGVPLASGPTAAEATSTDAATLIASLETRAGSTLTPLSSTERHLTNLVEPFGPQDLRTAFPGTDLATSGLVVSAGSPVDVAALAPARPRYTVTAPRSGSTAPTFAINALGTLDASGAPLGTTYGAGYRLNPAEFTVGVETAYRPLVAQPLAVTRFYTPPTPGEQHDVPYYADAVGTFDPTALAGADAAQNPLAYVPLGAYAPPATTLVAGPEGTPLAQPEPIGPTLNPAGFIAAPPSAITDLLGATLLRGPDPIDAIRVRVAGLGGFDARSQATVEQVASAIRALGLDAEIVAGASPEPVELYVPAYNVTTNLPSDLGYVAQHWTSLGAAQSVETGLGSTNLTLLALALAVAVAATIGVASIRIAGRASEVATLRAVGWSDAEIVRYVTADALLAGLFVEVLALVAAMLAAGSGGGASPIGLAAGFALAATLPTAAIIAAVVVLHQAGPSAQEAGETWRGVPTRGWLEVRGPLTLGFRAVLARPARSLVTIAAVGLAAGASALGIFVVATASVGPTLLAGAVSRTLGPFQDLLVVLIAASGVALALAVQRLELRDRAPEFRILAAVGWSPRALAASRVTSRVVLAFLAAPIAALVGYFGAVPVALGEPFAGAALGAALALTVVAWGALAGGRPASRRGSRSRSRPT